MVVQCCESASPTPSWGRAVPAARVREHQRSYSADTRATLEVVTDDGDRISLSLAWEQDVQARSIAVSGKGGRVAASQRTSSANLNVTVRTEGSIEEDELRDLRSLLQTLSLAIGKARRGVSGLGVPASLGSLASFDFAYSRQESWQTSETRAMVFG